MNKNDVLELLEKAYLEISDMPRDVIIECYNEIVMDYSDDVLCACIEESIIDSFSKYMVNYSVSSNASIKQSNEFYAQQYKWISIGDNNEDLAA